MKAILRSFSLAWHFLTILPFPVKPQNDPSPVELASSMIWYPAVGFGIGAGLLLCDMVLSDVLSPIVENLLLLIVLVIVTGGLHLDGLADALDGLAGGRTPEHRVSIMRDGHIGAIGAAGIMLALGLRYAGFFTLPQCERASFLVCMPAMGRWSMVLGSLFASPGTAQEGLAAPFLREITLKDVLWASALLGGAVYWVFGLTSTLILLVSVIVIVRAIVFFAMRVYNCVTGDVLGATNEITEIAFLVLGPILLRLL